MQSLGSRATLGTVVVNKSLTDDELRLKRIGQSIRERRKFLRYSMDELVNAIGDEVVYKQLIHLLETGRKEPRKLSRPQLQALARGLEWDLSTLASVLEIVLPEQLVTPPDHHGNSSITAGYANVRELIISHNRWMSAQLPLHLIPDNTTPEDTFFFHVQSSLLLSPDLASVVRVGMRIVFSEEAAQPHATVLLHDDKQNLYALATFEPSAKRIGVVSVDGSRAATLHMPHVVGVMRGYSLEATSLLE